MSDGRPGRWSHLVGRADTEAVARHLTATLGTAARLEPTTLEFVDVVQYYREWRPGEPHGPRKNAVALTCLGRVTGRLEPRGEALELRQFDVTTLPPVSAFGFGQGPVVHKAVAALGASQAKTHLLD